MLQFEAEPCYLWTSKCVQTPYLLRCPRLTAGPGSSAASAGSASCSPLEGLCLPPSHVAQQVSDLQALPRGRQLHCRGGGRAARAARSASWTKPRTDIQGSRCICLWHVAGLPGVLQGSTQAAVPPGGPSPSMRTFHEPAVAGHELLQAFGQLGRVAAPRRVRQAGLKLWRFHLCKERSRVTCITFAGKAARPHDLPAMAEG